MSLSIPTGATRAGVLALACAALFAPATAAANGQQLSGAIFTSELDASVFGTDYSTYPAMTAPANCTAVNANLYEDKRAVYLGGGPGNGQNNNLPDGDYFVKVTEPSSGTGETDLGTSVGTPTPQPAVVVGGLFQYCYQVWSLVRQNAAADPGFADTANAGGQYKVYISTESDFPNDESKTDSFKVDTAAPPVPQSPLTIAKTVDPSWTRAFDWSLTKTLVGDAVQYPTGSTTALNYAVVATKSAPTDTYEVGGTISVSNPNATGDATGVTVSEDGLGDPGATCTIDGDSSAYTGATIAAGATLELSYTCAYSAAPTVAEDANDASVTWDKLFSDATESDDTSASTTSATFSFATDPNTVIDDCSTVTDAFNGAPATTLGTPCATTTYNYTQTVPVTTNLCVVFGNAASAVESTTSATSTSSASVTICGRQVGGLTIGFWQNNNGQALINGNCPAVRDTLVSTLVNVANASKLPTITAATSCVKNNKGVTPLATAIYDVVKLANASGASMEAMLRAQIMATTLSTHFSPTLGAAKIALAKICTAVGTCVTGVGPFYTLATVGTAFATPNAGESVNTLISTVANKSWALASVTKTTQEVWKNVFDTLNNNKATITL